MTGDQHIEVQRLRDRTASALEDYRRSFIACTGEDDDVIRRSLCRCDDTEAEWRFRQRIQWINEAVYTKAAREATCDAR